MQVYITAIEEGFLYGLLALGIYISLRILDIPDLTTEVHSVSALQLRLLLQARD